MTFNNLDSFSQLLRERSYDDLEKQKLGKAISPRDKWNLKMDISSLKKELTDLQNTAAQLPDDYVEEICRSENYPLEDSIDNDMELNQWCDETENLLDDSLGLNESLFGGNPEKRLLKQMQRLQKKIDSCDDLAEKLELNKQILDLANKRSSLFYNSMNMPLTEDYKYKAKIGNSYLKGNGFTTKASEADTFESETEPRQRINQMRKDRKHTPKGDVSVEKIKENEQRITYFKLENLLKRAYRSKVKVSDDPIHEEVTCTIYCGAGFNVGVTATSYEDPDEADKVCFYVFQQFEDEIGEMNMGKDLEQTIKDLFRMTSDISEMEERPYIDDAEIRKLEDIANGQLLLFENINNRIKENSKAEIILSIGALTIIAACAFGIKSCKDNVADNQLKKLGCLENYEKYNVDGAGSLDKALGIGDTQSKAMYACVVSLAREKNISIDKAAKMATEHFGDRLKKEFLGEFTDGFKGRITGVSVGKDTETGERIVRVDSEWKESHTSGSGKHKHTYYTTEHGTVYIPMSEGNQYGIDDDGKSVNIGGSTFIFDESRIKKPAGDKLNESRMKYSESDNVNPSDIFNIVGECLEDYNFQKTTAKEPVPMTYRIQKVQDIDELSASVDGNYYDDIIVECNFSSHTGYSYIIITQDLDEQATWAGYTKNELRDDIVEAIKICLRTSKEHTGKKTFEVYLEELYDGDREAIGEFFDNVYSILGNESRGLMTKYMTKDEFASTFDKINNSIKNGGKQ